MARPRRGSSRNKKVTTDKPTQTKQTKGTIVMSSIEAFGVELSDDELNAALAGSRSRGLYDLNILTFLNSGRRGIQINLEDGDHEGKKSQSVKTGYESARERIAAGKTDADEDTVEAAKNTKVVGKTNPDRVFLLRQDVQAA